MMRKKVMYVLGILICLVGLSSCDLINELLGPIDTENNTEFAGSAEGWLIEGDAVQVEAEYSDSLGLNNSGYIFAKDNVTGGVWYFVAPEEYKGDKSKFFNGYIQFYLIQESALASQFYQKDVIINGGSGTLIYYFDSYPELTWTFYKIELNEEDSWYNEAGVLATNSEIQDVLSNIEKISIRGEYESGSDTGGLDSFSFKK